MKFLFDQNISHRIVSKIKTVYKNAYSVKDLHLQNSKDKQLWDFAKATNFTIITFDSDFADLATLYGHPPKIIWLRIGNISTNDLSLFLENKHSIISEFINNPLYKDLACLELITHNS